MRRAWGGAGLTAHFQPALDQRPHFDLGGFTDQHLHVAEISAKTLLAPQAQVLAMLGADLFEQLAAGPVRVLLVTRGADSQQRHIDVRQALPPITLALAERHRLRWWEALPWAAGIAAFFVPAGLGVREAMLAGYLVQYMNPGEAGLVALLARAWLTLAEGAGIGLGLALGPRRTTG